MKFGFFKNGKLVDSCHAENKEKAKSEFEHDEVHEIWDSSLLSAGTMDASEISVSGTKEMPIFNQKS